MIVALADIELISSILGTPQAVGENAWLWSVHQAGTGLAIVLTLSTNVDLGDGPATVVSAQTPQGYMELHGVTSLLRIEPDEVMFVCRYADRFSSIVVGKAGTCSQFANVQPALLRADLTQVEPSALLAALQLSLAEDHL